MPDTRTLVIMAASLGVVVAAGFALTSKIPLVRAAGYGFAAALFLAAAVAMVLSSEDGATSWHAAKAWALASLAIAWWAGRKALGAYRGDRA
jgi:hypothetical protein